MSNEPSNSDMIGARATGTHPTVSPTPINPLRHGIRRIVLAICVYWLLFQGMFLSANGIMEGGSVGVLQAAGSSLFSRSLSGSDWLLLPFGHSTRTSYINADVAFIGRRTDGSYIRPCFIVSLFAALLVLWPGPGWFVRMIGRWWREWFMPNWRSAAS